jgi:hypothetical protein
MLSLADFHVAFTGATLLVLSGLIFCLPLPADAAAAVSGHKPKPAVAAD